MIIFGRLAYACPNIGVRTDTVDPVGDCEVATVPGATECIVALGTNDDAWIRCQEPLRELQIPPVTYSPEQTVVTAPNVNLFGECIAEPLGHLGPLVVPRVRSTYCGVWEPVHPPLPQCPT